MAGDQSIWSVHKSATLEVLNEHFRTQQIKLISKKSAIVEYVTEENYKSTDYDNVSANFQEIDNREDGNNPQLNYNYKNKYDADYDN
ncbi:MAG: hypothetical protein K2J88_04365 [Oscillospiraceae bacterium]|nr:hypothetical protein [Oscillospiraceae bacterium]